MQGYTACLLLNNRLSSDYSLRTNAIGRYFENEKKNALSSGIENQRTVLPMGQLEKAETEMFHAKNSQIMAGTSKIRQRLPKMCPMITPSNETFICLFLIRNQTANHI
jgi:hypothetical protein